MLANISKSTKSALVKLGTFTVASVHAKVCARHGGMLHSLQRKTSASSIFKLPLGTSMVRVYVCMSNMYYIITNYLTYVMCIYTRSVYVEYVSYGTFQL